MTIKEIDNILTTIAVLDRPDLLKQILGFHDPFRLDFSEQYLTERTTEQLRHILMAAHLQSKQHTAAS